MILIFGTIFGGCIYKEKDSKIDPNIITNAPDNHTKRTILRALNHTQDIIKYVSSVNIVSEVPCEDAFGCTISNFTIDGKLISSDIYLLGPDAYKDSCKTFEHSLYHEIGHVVYSYKYGNYDIKGEDITYQDIIQIYAEKYADSHSPIRKEGCNKDVANELRNNLKRKEEIYKHAIEVMSKWDKYKDNIPSEMIDEYKYDYELYQNARKEHSNALDQYKYYLVNKTENKSEE